jgi:hypothetical protein
VSFDRHIRGEENISEDKTTRSWMSWCLLTLGTPALRSTGHLGLYTAMTESVTLMVTSLTLKMFLGLELHTFDCMMLHHVE